MLGDIQMISSYLQYYINGEINVIYPMNVSCSSKFEFQQISEYWGLLQQFNAFFFPFFAIAFFYIGFRLEAPKPNLFCIIGIDNRLHM